MMAGTGGDYNVGSWHGEALRSGPPCKIEGALPNLPADGQFRQNSGKVPQHPLFLVATGTIP